MANQSEQYEQYEQYAPSYLTVLGCWGRSRAVELAVAKCVAEELDATKRSLQEWRDTAVATQQALEAAAERERDMAAASARSDKKLAALQTVSANQEAEIGELTARKTVRGRGE
eukprot:1193094-Prorocentrum_minimum.AAC.2